MEAHKNLSDLEFELKFQNCSLNPSWFTHEAHLRLAYIHIQKYGLQAAIENMCVQIKAFAKKHGATMKYNETVTVAATRVMHHFMARSECTTFQEFIEKNPRLPTDFRALLASHYCSDIFKSPEAKQKFLEPDLLPFE